MTGEIIAAVQSMRLLMDVLKANKALTNFNELSAAVAEVSAKLMNAQSAALVALEKQATLTERMHELEKENMELKNWNQERERYELAEISPRVFTYHLKSSMEQGEPVHDLCTNCFTQGKKSILQSIAPGQNTHTSTCGRCQMSIQITENWRGRTQ